MVEIASKIVELADAYRRTPENSVSLLPLERSRGIPFPCDGSAVGRKSLRATQLAAHAVLAVNRER